MQYDFIYINTAVIRELEDDRLFFNLKRRLLQLEIQNDSFFVHNNAGINANVKIILYSKYRNVVTGNHENRSDYDTEYDRFAHIKTVSALTCPVLLLDHLPDVYNSLCSDA